MAVYLIDYENVYVDGLQGIENLTEQDSVYIFYTQNRCGLTFQLYEKLISCHAKIHLNEVSMSLKAGEPVKNALDMQLIMFAGYLIGKQEDSEIYIISKDKDFLLGMEFYQNYIHNDNILLQIIPSIHVTDSNLTEQQHLQEYHSLVTSLQEVSEQDAMIQLIHQLDASIPDLPEQYHSPASDTQHQNTVKNILGKNISKKELAEISEIIKKSNTLVELNNALSKYYRNSQKSKTIYHKLKPQFEYLHRELKFTK